MVSFYLGRMKLLLLLLAALLLLGLTPGPAPALPLIHAQADAGLRTDGPDSGLAALLARQGTWAYASASHGPRYLAIPEGPGFDVTVCGPLDCLERVSTDAGPVLSLQRAGRIGDLSSADFQAICGPLSAGLCSGSYTILGVADQSREDPPEHEADRRMRLEDRELPETDAL